MHPDRLSAASPHPPPTVLKRQPHLARIPAASWQAIERLFSHLGWFGVFLLLAPFLGPRDYGLFILAAGGIAILESLFGEVAAQTLLRQPQIDERHASTLFVTTAGCAAAVSLVLCGLARAAASMLGANVLIDMFQSLALLPMLGALLAVPRALLLRRGRTAPLAAAATVGTAAGGAVAITLAVAGAGAWSLVAQLIVHRFFEIAILWSVGARGVGLRWSRRHFGELAAALDIAALAPALRSAARHVPCLIAGVALGPVAAGLYLVG